MKPKQTIDPNVAGEEFKKLLAEDRIALKNIRAAKATRKQQLKAALTVVWEALGKGITVNGYNTREDWAKNFAGYSRRQCEYIVYGRPDRTGESVRTTVRPLALLKELITFISEQPRYKTDPNSLREIRGKAAEIAGEELNWFPPVWKKEMDDEKAAELAERESLERTSITHAKVSARKTVCEAHFINRPKIKGKVFAEKWDDATCPDCVRFVKEGEEKRRKNDEEREADYAEAKAERVKSAIVTHRYGGVTAGGGQNTRMRDYALCGARFSGSSWTTKQKHVSATKDDTPTCEKCRKLIAEQQVSEPAQALAAAIDAAPVPYDTEAYAKAENWSQRVCIIGPPENLKWHADPEYRRNNPVVDPNADDEFAGERD